MSSNIIPARILAALIDYAVVKGTAFFIFPNSIVGYLLLASFYFTLGASRQMKGASAGKWLFGLYVTSADKNKSTEEPPAPNKIESEQVIAQKGLALPQAFKRFFFLYGLLIILAELPHFAFSQMGFSGAPEVLDLNLLLALMLFFSILLSFLFNRSHRGWHDIASGSVVCRIDSEQLETPALLSPKKIWGISFSLGLFLWFIMLPKEPLTRRIYSEKFQIKHDTGLELLGARLIPEEVLRRSRDCTTQACPNLQVHFLSKFELDTTEKLLSETLTGLDLNQAAEVSVSFIETEENWTFLYNEKLELLEKKQLNNSSG